MSTIIGIVCVAFGLGCCVVGLVAKTKAGRAAGVELGRLPEKKKPREVVPFLGLTDLGLRKSESVPTLTPRQTVALHLLAARVARGGARHDTMVVVETLKLTDLLLRLESQTRPAAKGGANAGLAVGDVLEVAIDATKT